MRVEDHVYLEKADLRAMSDLQLTRLGVKMADRKMAMLECKVCGVKWTPEIDSNGKLPYNYWACPAKCNER